MKIHEILLTWSEQNQKAVINNRIIDDFIEFKNKNELRFCTLHQSKYNDRKLETIWCTTIKYLSNDLDAIQKDFSNFCQDNIEECCQISKITCQENTYIAEYSVYRNYIVNYT
jgi:hypothetical protein